MDLGLLIANEVAELLRVSEQRVYELSRTGVLPTIRLGERQYRYSKRAILEWLERGGSSEKAPEGDRDAGCLEVKS
jgi:excisionase family DNA binding protein